ncbi:MAG: DUF2219 family protein [Bacteroidia bacterium]
MKVDSGVFDRRFSYCLILPLVLIFSSLNGQSAKSLHYYFDNDLLYFPRNNDRDYTFGMGMGITGTRKTHAPARRETLSLMGDLRLYTPDNLRATRILHRDRPYASLFSLTVNRTSFFPEKGLILRHSLEAGVLGLFLAREVQSSAHALSRTVTGKEYPYEPMGWGNQISAGGEPTLRYSFETEQQIPFLTWRSIHKPGKEYFALNASGGLDLGYLTRVSAGLSARLGAFQPMGNFSRKREFFFQCRYQAFVYGYNALLQGQFRPSAHTLTYEDLHPLVRQWEAGFTWHHKWFSTSYLLIHRSAEMRNTNHPHHYYGRWTMTFQL